MNDATVLADKLVEAGMVEKNGDWYTIELSDYEADDLLTDWRVAGKCLQSWPTTINTEQLDMTLDEMLRDPRAIIEAWYEAQNNE